MSLMSVGVTVGSAGPTLGAVTIDLDKTVLLQMALFALLIVILKPLLFDPVLEVFALREERTDGARKKARELQIEAGVLLTEYEKQRDRIAAAASEERDLIRQETNRQEAAILEEARTLQAKIVGEGREEIDRQTRLIRAQLEKESQRLAGTIVRKVLGREVAL